ncbi:MotA/TolQ/ExbB proton channel family protein [Paludisphaera sp.]|uniref:MotA/TolQ/ExbB proton channel family protein n=1 Tax=Paludisphaera sp. TaxID=2017432 RepID=UPI00301BBEA9
MIRRIAAALIGASLMGGAAVAEEPRGDLAVEAQRRAARVASGILVWYERTPAGERMAWGGLAACAALGACATAERLFRLRRRAVVPNDFLVRFVDRLHAGKLDGGQALDYCEMHPSPAARVALAAVRRWGRPATELERAVDLAHRWESEQLRRNVGTLRRIAALAPLIGLFGSLLMAQRLLRLAGDGPIASASLADALGPLACGVGLGVVSMALNDVLATRVERLGGMLDRLGAETIDAVAMTTAVAAPTLPAAAPAPHIRIGEPRGPVVAAPVRVSSPRARRDEPSVGA